LVAVRPPWQAKRTFSRLSCHGALAAPSKASILAFILSRCVRPAKQSVHFRAYFVAVRPPCRAKCVFSRLSCRGSSAVACQVYIFAISWSRCVRRAHHSVYFRVDLVAARSLWQAKCAFSCLSCRGAFAAPSKACIFAFILSRCVRRGKQSVHFSVYLVAVRPPRQAKRVFSRLSCRGALAAASKVCIFAFILSRFVRRVVTRKSFPRFIFSRVLILKHPFLR